MTQVMRDKLQAFCDSLKAEVSDEARYGSQQVAGLMAEVIRELESILATEPPAVTVRAGWYTKDFGGFWYFAAKPVFLSGYWVVGSSVAYDRVNRIVTDPWPDHPNGGPECCMEIK